MDQGPFFGFLEESQSTAPMPMDISCSQAALSMEISSGLGFERPDAHTASEIEVRTAATLRDVGSTLLLFLTSRLSQTLAQAEELCMFALKDGRTAAVWVAHCNPDSCCAVCVYSLIGVVGPSVTDVALSLPEELRRYAATFLRKSGTKS